MLGTRRGLRRALPLYTEIPVVRVRFTIRRSEPASGTSISLGRFNCLTASRNRGAVCGGLIGVFLAYRGVPAAHQPALKKLMTRIVELLQETNSWVSTKAMAINKPV